MILRSDAIPYAMRRTLPLLLLLMMIFSPLVEANPAQAAPAAQGVLQRIRFAPGATSAVVEGNLAGSQVARYVLTALAGQSMNVQAFAEGAPVFVTLFNTNGTILGSASSREQWTGTLPATGDYTLHVYPSPYVANTAFRLRVEITSASRPPDPAPERIRFERGAVSAQVTGYLPSAANKVYLLSARAGQVMTVESWSGGGPFRFTVAEENGTWLGAANGGERWSGTLPRTQDYRITLYSPADAPSTTYGLLITIVGAAPMPTATPIPTPTPTPMPQPEAQRIRFQQGSTDTTVWGYIDSATPARYVLRALRGQRMNLRLLTQQGYPARVTIRGEQGNFLGSASVGELWAGDLPATQDYYLEVQSPPDRPGANFLLWIQIQ
ncbi:MAG: hypothetical protein IT328_06640 [Caldilineaceae bacterium]|nr:hypothetical protein [Caldilineaceae bacterium]